MLEKVKQLVVEASSLMKTGFEVFTKNTQDNIVTSADVAVQKFLEENLTALLPGSGFLGEESDPSHAEREYCWIVDPIDGTMNFSRGLNQSAISVGLRKDEDVILGVVYNPFNEEMFWAEKGKGAFLNGKPIHVSDKTFDKSLVCTALCVYRKEFSQLSNEVFYDIFSECSDFRRFGVCSLELCYLAAGRADLYFEYSLYPWDYAASICILTEAGGVIGSPSDNSLSLSHCSPVIAANNEANYRQLKGICNRHFTEVGYSY